MHYYKFNIADWHLATSHLTLEEEAIYFKLVNFYYDTEQPIPLETETVIRRLRLGLYSETVGLVLSEFFVLQEDGWHHNRCDEEIEHYHSKAEKNKIVGKLGGRPRKNKDLQTNPNGFENKPIDNPNITLTKNHKPITSREVTKVTKGTRWSKELPIPDSWIDYCKTKRPELNPYDTFESFTDYWVSVAGSKGVKLDWDATWRTWVRNQRATFKQPPKSNQFAGAI
jgi:uncharacterized protein YdaU (DUF1376 family)